MGTQVDVKIPSLEPGLSVVQVAVTTTAAANAAVSHTFTKAFSAAPTVLGVVRFDANAVNNFCPYISALSATAFTLTVSGTSTVDHTYYVTFLGKLAAST
jgi:hypothetical protein